MKKESTLAYVRPLLPRSRTLGYASIILLGGLLLPALAQKKGVVDPSQSGDWAAGMINHVQKMHNLFTHHDVDQSTQSAPPDIPKVEIDPDPSGGVETFQPAGPTSTAENPFFQNLGTNGRTCFTCHQPQTGWTISAASASERFQASGGTDPLFRSIDGATCPTDDVSTLGAKRRAFKLLIEKGLIRIGLPLPPINQPLKFEVTHVDDPYNCTTNPVTGLQSPTMGILSMYRRPLPSTNLGFDSGIMWDGREPSFESQAADATAGHAERDPHLPPLSDEQKGEIVAFEKGLFTAQIFDNKAHELNAAHATGGPIGLPQQLSKFLATPNLNDPFMSGFDPNIFNLYKPWLDLPDANGEAKDRESIARGEEVFNTTKFNITGVAGLPGTVVGGFCGTCHDSPNVGNHTKSKVPLNIGIANAGADSPPGLDSLDISGLPVFTLQCVDGREFHVTDPGRALISGDCDDIGKFKGPILRGLAARAPYFHNGSAATLMDVVNFYNKRFNIGLTNQQKKDLVNFLKTL